MILTLFDTGCGDADLVREGVVVPACMTTMSIVVRVKMWDIPFFFIAAARAVHLGSATIVL